MSSLQAPVTWRDLALVLFGALLVLLGLLVFGGGAWLVALGGSPYYLLIGLGLLVSGALLAMRRPEGGWLYFAVFGAAVIWTLWEVGRVDWLVLSRLLGLAVLALTLLGFAPVLRRWAALHERLMFRPVTALVIVAGVGIAAHAATTLVPGSSYQSALWQTLPATLLSQPL